VKTKNRLFLVISTFLLVVDMRMVGHANLVMNLFKQSIYEKVKRVWTAERPRRAPKHPAWNHS
jgi:hypothetical protein